MRTLLVSVVVGLVGLAGLVGRGSIAHAYPQYQLSRDTTCTSCHVAPDGGGLLTENGLAVAESTSWRPGDSSFMYGLGTPSWLQLGGDLRAAAGFVDPGVPSAAAYPMQAEVIANVATHGFSLYATGGLRRPQEGGSIAHVFWSRQHYLQWQQKPGETDGLYLRVGRLLPTFGLRLAEHVVYTQRYGGRRLYDEAYAVAASYVTPAFEVHATGFIADPIATRVEQGNGVALYAEVRVGEHAALGVEGKRSASDDQTRTFAGVTAKLHLPGPDVLLQGEAQLILTSLEVGAGDDAKALAGYVLASHPLGASFLLDVGVGHYTQDTRVKGLYRDCADVNLHWFMTSHVEWLVTTRLEILDAAAGPNGGYALAQLHYRL